MAKTPDSAQSSSLLRDLEAGLRINKHELDEAWVEQPDIFYRVAANLALAISVRDQVKMDLNNLIAELDAEIRKEAARAGEKVTETGIAKQIDQMPAVLDKRKHYGDLCYKVDQWAALKESFSQRSYALKDLTALHIANYYQNNSGGAGRDARDRVADDVRQAAGARREERPTRVRPNRE